MIIVVVTAYEEGSLFPLRSAGSMELTRLVGHDVLNCLWQLQQSLTGVDIERMAVDVAKIFKRESTA